MPQSTLANWTRELLERDYYEPRDTAGDITKKVRVDVPDSDGRLDPTTFADWPSTVEEYFDWSEKRRVRFARMKLLNLAKVWSNGAEGT